MKKGYITKMLGKWQLYVMLLPAMVYVFIFSYMPIYGVQISFKDFSAKLGIWGSEWVGLEYFKQFLSYPKVGDLLLNTLRIGLYSLATFPLPVIFALMLNEVRSTKYKKFVQMVSYIPYFLSTVVVCSMITLFLKKSGIVNTIITSLGGSGGDLLTRATLFEDIYVWSGVWQSLGWGSIIYIAALSGVPSDLVEAARIDGAKRLQIIWHVNIAWIIPTIVIMLIFSCGSIISVGQDKVLLLQNALNLSRSQVISTYVYEIGLLGGQFSYASAIGLFNNVVNVTMLLIVNWIAKKVSDVSLW